MNRKLSQLLESVEVLDYPEQKNVDNLAIDNENPEDVLAAEEAWAGGANLHQQIDHSKAAGSEPTTRGQEILKIKENTLRSVIKKFILEKIKLSEEVLGEPDLSSEEEREDSKEDELDEISALAGGAVRGIQAPLGFDYDPENANNKLRKK